MIEKPIENGLIEEVLEFLTKLELFQKLDRSSLHALASSMSLIQLGGGETVIEEGEMNRTLYILWQGRLRVYKNETPIAEIAVGEMVGEIALLTGEPRTATVRAIRDSVLIKLAYSPFKNFEEVHPKGVAEIAKQALIRLIANRRNSQPGEEAVTITIAPAGDSNHTPFLHRFVKELKRVGSTILVNRELCNRHFNREIAQMGPTDSDSLVINNWLTELENTYRFVIYETDLQLTMWTKRCLRQADTIFLVAEEGRDPQINPIEGAIDHLGEIIPTTLLIFVHTTQTGIKGTHYWHQIREVQGYHHVNLLVEKDYGRLIRFITGQAFGVVLNGGGMRGFAHVGVLKALEELKIPIDYIGGCSIGAAIGAAYSRTGSYEETVEICYMKDLPSTSTDYTFPVVSLLKGKNVCKFYRKIYQDDYIEDLQIPFFCVSTDLTEGKLHVHDRGVLWEAIRASSSIPVVYPPMYDEKGGMLVDGALLNNMPVDVMRRHLGGGKILAVDCNIEPLLENKLMRHPWLSGWKLFFQQLLPSNRRRLKFMSIFKISYNSLMLSSTRNEEEAKRNADYLIEIETRKFGVLRLQEMDEIIELGYRSAMEQLPGQLRT